MSEKIHTYYIIIVFHREDFNTNTFTKLTCFNLILMFQNNFFLNIKFFCLRYLQGLLIGYDIATLKLCQYYKWKITKLI